MFRAAIACESGIILKIRAEKSPTKACRSETLTYSLACIKHTSDSLDTFNREVLVSTKEYKVLLGIFQTNIFLGMVEQLFPVTL